MNEDFKKLPCDAWCKIIVLLSSIVDMHNLRLTCKFFHQSVHAVGWNEKLPFFSIYSPLKTPNRYGWFCDVSLPELSKELVKNHHDLIVRASDARIVKGDPFTFQSQIETVQECAKIYKIHVIPCFVSEIHIIQCHCFDPNEIPAYFAKFSKSGITRVTLAGILATFPFQELDPPQFKFFFPHNDMLHAYRFG